MFFTHRGDRDEDRDEGKPSDTNYSVTKLKMIDKDQHRKKKTCKHTLCA